MDTPSEYIPKVDFYQIIHSTPLPIWAKDNNERIECFQLEVEKSDIDETPKRGLFRLPRGTI